MMKELIKKVAAMLGLRSESKRNVVWVILFRRKAEFTKEGDVGETYVCSSPFRSEWDALRHKESLEKELMGFDVIDIQRLETKADVSVAKYDYTISDEHPRVTVEYEEL